MALVVSSQSNKIFKFFSSKLYKIRARSFQSLILRFSKPKSRALYHPQSLERTCANFLHTGGANCNTLIYRYVGRNKEVPVMWIIRSTVSAMVAYVDPLSSKWSQLPVCWKKNREHLGCSSCRVAQGRGCNLAGWQRPRMFVWQPQFSGSPSSYLLKQFRPQLHLQIFSPAQQQQLLEAVINKVRKKKAPSWNSLANENSIHWHHKDPKHVPKRLKPSLSRLPICKLGGDGQAWTSGGIVISCG